MRLLVYEHPCKARHGVIDAAAAPEGQSTLAGSVNLQVPEYDYMRLDAKALRNFWFCQNCEHVERHAEACCNGRYRMALDERQIAELPEKLRLAERASKEAENEVEDLKSQIEDLSKDLRSAENEIDGMQGTNGAATTIRETLDSLVKDIELYLSQVTNNRTTYADAGKHLGFLRDLAMDARKRMTDAESACA